MTKSSIGRIIKQDDGSALIEVDEEFALDPDFPFRPGDNLRIRIDGNQVVVERARRKPSTGSKRMGKCIRTPRGSR